MNDYIDVPVEAAKHISEEFKKNQVIIVCWDQEHRRTHVTTYGHNGRDSKEAAIGGNMVRQSLGWPEELCHEKSNRNMCADIRELKKRRPSLF